MINLLCQTCKKPFSVYASDHRWKTGNHPRFCSRKCMGIAMRTYVICQHCGIKFRGRTKRKYCSNKCKARSQGPGNWKDPEYIKEYMRRYNEINRERINAQKAEYRRNHREQTREIARKRRAAGRGQGPKQRNYKRYIRAKGYCVCCGTTERLEIDHIVPLADNGSDIPENWQVLCRSCNARKFTKSIDYEVGIEL